MYFIFYLPASSYSSSLELLLTWWREEQDSGTSCLELQLLHEICHRVTSSPNTLSPHPLMHVTRALLQSEGLTCVLYPPCFCKLGVRRDGLSFPDGDIFNKGHGGYVDIWALKVIIGSDGGL